MAGLIIISVLLALDLLALLIMGVYASYSQRWTNELDSFAMMRIATAMAEPLPLMIGLKKDKMNVLEQMPVSLRSTTTFKRDERFLTLRSPTGMDWRYSGGTRGNWATWPRSPEVNRQGKKIRMLRARPRSSVRS
jgi:hypothetical protein